MKEKIIIKSKWGGCGIYVFIILGYSLIFSIMDFYKLSVSQIIIASLFILCAILITLLFAAPKMANLSKWQLWLIWPINIALTSQIIEQVTFQTKTSEMSAVKCWNIASVLNRQGNYHKAFSYMERAAKMGYPRAQYEVGLMYELGRDNGMARSKDIMKAVPWYIAAAQSDDKHVRDDALSRLIYVYSKHRKHQEKAFAIIDSITAVNPQNAITILNKLIAIDPSNTGLYDSIKIYTFEKAYINTIPDGIIKNHEYVDLGLPSCLKWATCNVGASSITIRGNYYSWGETTTKKNYGETKGKVRTDISGSPQYDVARSKWGGSWRMPTKRETDELMTKCSWTWISIEGFYGYKVVGPNGKSIFLPAAGYYADSLNTLAGVTGRYWTSTPENVAGYAYSLTFGNISHNGNYDSSGLGMSIRPVTK